MTICERCGSRLTYANEDGDTGCSWCGHVAARPWADVLLEVGGVGFKRREPRLANQWKTA